MRVIGVQSTQQKVRDAVKEQQKSVRNILQLAPVPQDEPDCRYCLATYRLCKQYYSVLHTCTLAAHLCLSLKHSQQ